MAPANIRKEGSFFDLPIAIGILCSMGFIKNPPKEDVAFIGELSLDGKVNNVNGILPMCIEGKKSWNKENNCTKRKCFRSKYYK